MSSFGLDFPSENAYGGDMLTQTDLKNIGQLMDEKLEKQKQEIVSEVDGKLEKVKKEILTGVADFMADNLMPLLEKHDRRLEHLERHDAHPPGMAVGS